MLINKNKKNCLKNKHKNQSQTIKEYEKNKK
jgi:hypothetical protein